MQVSISSITILPPPHIPGDLQQKFTATLGLLHPTCSFCLWGWGFVGIAREGAGICL